MQNTLEYLFQNNGWSLFPAKLAEIEEIRAHVPELNDSIETKRIIYHMFIIPGLWWWAESGELF